MITGIQPQNLTDNDSLISVIPKRQGNEEVTLIPPTAHTSRELMHA